MMHPSFEWIGCAESERGPFGIADSKSQESAPAGVPSMFDSLEVKVLYST